jgi:methionyl-tRNA formyltransferase
MIKFMTSDKTSVPSTLIMTGDALRHKFVADTLADTLNVVGVVSEQKKAVDEARLIGKEVAEKSAVLLEHFAERDKKEQEYFGAHQQFCVRPQYVLSVPYGQANSDKAFEWIRARAPDYVLLFGSSLIKDPLLGYFGSRMINMHLGLSPYYRGSGTNFWPLADGTPECVGATVHLATAEVDGGAILGQVRPAMYEDDRSHDIGCKAIIAGARLFSVATVAYHKKSIVPRMQDDMVGKEFRRRDFCADAVEKMHQNFDDGMIKKYIKKKQERDAAFPIFMLED